YLRNFFTPAEVKYAQERYKHFQGQPLAARGAAKIGLSEELAMSEGNFPDIEILRGDDNAPQVHLSESAQLRTQERGIKKIHVSLAHTREVGGAAILIVPTHGDKTKEMDIGFDLF